MSLTNKTMWMAVGALLLAAGCATAPPAVNPAPSCPGAVRPPSPEMSMRAKQSADSLIREAIAQKRWTVQYRQTLFQTLPNLTDCDRLAVLKSLAQATNRGDLKFEEGAFPLF